jgi:hypothetical protein
MPTISREIEVEIDVDANDLKDAFGRSYCVLKRELLEEAIRLFEAGELKEGRILLEREVGL